MGARKKLAAEKRKEAMKETAIASLRNVNHQPAQACARWRTTSAAWKWRRPWASCVQHTPRQQADLEKLLMSAIANWEAKNEGHGRGSKAGGEKRDGERGTVA
jgi:large subunit ribosomal protein L22